LLTRFPDDMDRVMRPGGENYSATFGEKYPAVDISNDLEKLSPILPGSSLSNLHYSFSGKGLTGKEDVAGTTPTVFVVVSGRLSWQTGDGRSRLANKLSW